MTFVLHPRLARDFHVLGRCGARGALQLLLHRNAHLPWFLLVPESPALELFELEPTLRAELQACGDILARFAKARFACDKMNVAAIGNLVPQLHLHVIGRRHDDSCWPEPVWGRQLVTALYSAAELAALCDALAPLAEFHFRPASGIPEDRAISGTQTAGNDDEAICETVRRYFEGRKHADRARLETAFAVEAGHTTGYLRDREGRFALSVRPLREVIEGWVQRAPAADMQGRILSLQVFNGISALVAFDFNGLFIDTFQLAKIDGEWKILNNFFVDQ